MLITQLKAKETIVSLAAGKKVFTTQTLRILSQSVQKNASSQSFSLC